MMKNLSIDGSKKEIFFFCVLCLLLLAPMAVAAEGYPTDNQSISTDELLPLISSWYQKNYDEIIQPGWLKATYYKHDIMRYQTPYPLPEEYQDEFWFHINEDREADMIVTLWISQDGTRTPTGVHMDGVDVSFIENNVLGAWPYLPLIDMNFEKDLKENANNPLCKYYTTETLDPLPATLEIELVTEYPDDQKSYNVIDTNKKVWGKREVYDFDTTTGLLLKYEHAYIREDMELVPTGVTANFVYVPNAELPDEIQGLIERAKLLKETYPVNTGTVVIL